MNYRSLFIELAFVVLFILTGLNLIGAGIETGAASTNADLSYDVGIEILGAGIVGFFFGS